MRRVRFPRDDRARQVLEILKSAVHDDDSVRAAIAMRAAEKLGDVLVFDLDDDVCEAAARRISGFRIIGKACLFFTEAQHIEVPRP